MNEVAACFLEHIPDESEAFWCFERFLRAYRSHFIITPRATPTKSPAAAASSASAAAAAVAQPQLGVRDRLTELGAIFRRCDAPLW